MVIGKVIRKWRVTSEISLRDAADAMKLDQATLLRVEQGKMPSAETLRNIVFWLLKDDQ